MLASNIIIMNNSYRYTTFLGSFNTLFEGYFGGHELKHRSELSLFKNSVVIVIITMICSSHGY